MLRDITRRQRVKIEEHKIQFMYDSDGGYSFPCDENGNLLPMEDCARKNYDYCMEHPEQFETWNKKITRERYITENATGICDCGEKVELWDQYMSACECPGCGRWYNLFGQELNHPDTWASGGDW